MPDPNARRDKALEGIARELGETNKLLKQIERNTRRVKFTNTPDESERPDAFDVPQQPQPGASGTDGSVSLPAELEDKRFPEPTHPYLRRSPSGEAFDNDGPTGPYGVGPRPYA